MSYWHLTAPPAIGGREGWLPKRAEVAIIGGGLAGLLTAYRLGEEGVRAVVIESSEIGYGQSGASTGKVSVATGLTYHRLFTERGADAARAYAEAQLCAVEAYRRIILEERICCDMERLPAVLYTRDDPALLEQEAVAARAAGLRVELRRRTALPFDVSLTLSYPAQAQLHPVKFLAALSRRVEIFMGLTVTDVHGHTIVTDDGQELEAQKIVYACHYPIKDMPGLFFMKLSRSLSYGIALRGIPPLPAMYNGIDRGGLSLRSHGDTLLLVGGAHRTGEWGRDPAHTGLSYLRAAAARYFPRVRIAATWAGQDCMSPDALPLIGAYSALAPDQYVATGFSKWGLTGSMIAATVLTDLIVGRQNAVAAYLHPGRFGRETLRAAVSQAGQTALGLGRRLQRTAEFAGEFAPEAGDLSHSPVCTHLRCALTWNGDTETWDCPCHGSRFTSEGRVISSPAVHPLRQCARTIGHHADESGNNHIERKPL